jgi:septum formation protein
VNILPNNFKIILGSSSPRRQQFFKEIGLDFEVRLKPVEETYPQELKRTEISDYLSYLKADSLKNTLVSGEVLITSDTVVWHKGKSLAKPSGIKEAYEMLRTLSGDTHEVITSVCFTTISRQKIINSITEVTFDKLSDKEIEYYIEKCNPFDKAGGYGIQEWIGLIGISNIKGSYTNVVGLPTNLVYKTLKEMID